MDRKQVKEMLPILVAFTEGKTIQSRYIKGDTTLWYDNENPSFNDDDLEYRIKPEPKYRHFKDKEECWKEMLQHSPLGWFKDKKDNEFFTLNCISDKDPKIKTYEYLFNDCVFMDGSICGVKVEE